MKIKTIIDVVSYSSTVLLLWLSLMTSQQASADLLDPDCTVEKAAKSAASKAAIGIGGRCSPSEAARDTAKRAVGIEDKGPVERLKSGGDNDDGVTKSVVKKVMK